VIRKRLLLAACAALQPILLGGCVAAVVPVVAGSMIAKKQVDRNKTRARKGKVEVVTTAEPAASRRSARPKAPSVHAQRRQAAATGKRERQATPRDAQVAAANGEPTPQRLRPIENGDIPEFAASGSPVALTGLTALPAPGAASGASGSGFPLFIRFALAAAQPKPGQPFRSALIDPSTLTTAPKRRDCATQAPAVLIDLDPGRGVFDLDNPPAAAPGLAEQLASLRTAGLTILWSASLPTTASEKLYNILAATGLDTDRTDRLLLLGAPGERKQARRQAAARDWCILAIAGDSKGDFEEAFDYLRDPNGPIAQTLSANLGDGWFLTPQPIS
jgi:hypothetical protein